MSPGALHQGAKTDGETRWIGATTHVRVSDSHEIVSGSLLGYKKGERWSGKARAHSDLSTGNALLWSSSRQPVSHQTL